jgi:cytochrome b561
MAELASTFPRYRAPAIAFHWIAALLILGNLAFGLWMVGLPLSPQKLKYLSWHKWVGITVLLVSAARLCWRLRHPPPPLPASMKPWEARASAGTHVLLYVLFFAAPLSGWLFSSAAGFKTVYLGLIAVPDLLDKNRELAEILKVVHRWINYSLAAVVVAHIAAAMKHEFVERDTVLARMLPQRPRDAP